MTTSAFRKIVWDYYRQHGRHDLPWRQLDNTGSIPAYYVVVSELMLQQTQVSRVVPKFETFLQQFPTIQLLAAAPLAEVLKAWSGLGYNRRAKFLWQAAQNIATHHAGVVPASIPQLVALPGIGPNTAGAIMAYAYNQPVVFVETNIRTVFIHHFFADQTAVPDKALLPIIADAVPAHEARDWYWALMDYGTYLKQTVGNVSRHSHGYTKQSAFEGSRRQIRGQVLRLLGERSHTLAELQELIADERLGGVLDDLSNEQLIRATADVYQLAA